MSLIAVVVTALVLVSGAIPASAATRTGPTGKLTLHMVQTQRDVLDLGSSGTTVGDVVTGSGDLLRSDGGAVIGSWAYRAETVRVSIPGGTENRLSTQWFSLGKGSIMVTGLISLQQGTRPTASQALIIVGGTGIYAGSKGTMRMTVQGPDDYTAAFRFVS
jgi:hypothetical protein